MSKMKELSIELQNSLKGTVEYHKGMTRDEFDIKMHEDYIRIVDQSGMPHWVWEEYKTDLTQQYYTDSDKAMRLRDIESPSPDKIIYLDELSVPLNDCALLSSDLNTTELMSLLDYENFKASGKGEDYCAFFGNWEDAYDKYLSDLGYHQQEQDIDYLCRLNGLGD
jgi:hypothetical protein